ncbi:PfkB family carbohydrate kinase [Actinoallomurus sp. CA-142502]|uniref:PfkB family carbohydrate kinase n=1 Tax=Actinoallomurus sp. CA-142502 TaxID=3239885 RepID=UPI003D8A5A60
MGDSELHVAKLNHALGSLDLPLFSRWGKELAERFETGRKLLVAGNGGSAAQAQHLTAELIGRFGQERRPLSAVALHSDTSTITAAGNDFGFDEIFARQVMAHGLPGDVLLLLSTSGQSSNLLRAAHVARERGVAVWAITGPGPHPLGAVCDEYTAVVAETAATIQECHLVAINLICANVEASVGVKREPLRRRPSNQKRLVVVGDVLLDRDIIGSVERISPEAPVPVVGALRETLKCGGAGLTAVLAATKGYRVTLISALSLDEDAATVRELLEEAGVVFIDLRTTSPTAVKTRVRAGTQTLLMLDRAAPPTKPGGLTATGRKAILTADSVVVSDYGRGIAAAKDIRAVLSNITGRIPIVWDPHPRGPAPVPGVTLVTPNDSEARSLLLENDHTVVDSDAGLARALRRQWKVGGVVITKGAAGAVYIGAEESPPLVVPTPKIFAEDTCGAGDLFAATAASLLGSGALASEAVVGAVAAASDHVAPRISQSYSGDFRESAFETADRVRAAGGTVVATGGCFDLLHRGHIAMLQQARRLGDCLIVCLNGNASVTRLKGKGRPVVPVEDRMAIISALTWVDGVVVFDEDTPTEVIKRLRPHIWVKGGDYAIGDLPERETVEAHGGELVLVPYLDGRSSTSLIESAVRRRDQQARPQ